MKKLTKEWAATKGDDAKQVATFKDNLDKLHKQLNTSPLSSDIQMEVKNKENELVEKLKSEEANYTVW